MKRVRRFLWRHLPAVLVIASLFLTATAYAVGLDQHVHYSTYSDTYECSSTGQLLHTQSRTDYVWQHYYDYRGALIREEYVGTWFWMNYHTRHWHQGMYCG